MSKIRTLYATNYSDLKLGGQKSMISLLENMDQDEFELHVICPEEGELAKKCREIGCKVHFHTVWKRNIGKIFKILKSYIDLRKIIKDNSIQVLHSDNEINTFMYVKMLKNLNIKHLWHLRVANKFKYDHIIQEHVDAIVGVSDATKKRILESNYYKYRTIYDGVDTEVFAPVTKERKTILRKQLNIDNSFSILFVGQLKYEKGIYEMVDAFISLVRDKQINNAKLYILGTALDRGIQAKLESIITENLPEAQNSVLFKGHSNKIYEWMQACDLVVLPSHIEGLGRVIFEAMACGTPVIGTDISGINEIITKETGCLVPAHNSMELASAIEKMIFEPSQYELLKTNGRKRALEHFDIKKHAEKISEVYRELANGEN